MLRIPPWSWTRSWTARRSLVMEDIKLTIPLEALIKKQQLSYFGHIMQRENSLEKSIMLGMGGGARKRGRPRARWLFKAAVSREPTCRAPNGNVLGNRPVGSPTTICWGADTSAPERQLADLSVPQRRYAGEPTCLGSNADVRLVVADPIAYI